MNIKIRKSKNLHNTTKLTKYIHDYAQNWQPTSKLKVHAFVLEDGFGGVDLRGKRGESEIVWIKGKMVKTKVFEMKVSE